MQINKRKCKALHLSRHNARHQYMLRADQLEGSFVEKDLEVLLDTKLNMSQQGALEQTRLMVSRAALGGLLPADERIRNLPSALLRPLDCCVQL